MLIERVPISSVRVGARRRQDLGDIPALARNIDRHGLLHPVIVADDGELIAGERRLRACQSLGWTEIDARRWPDLSAAERREIELAENVDRKDLTAAERSRMMVQWVETAAQVDRQEFRTDSVRNPTGGRPQEPGSLRRVSERTGIPVNTIKTARQHVAAIDTYPELTPLPQTDALKIAAKLDAMDEEERIEARAAVASHDSATMARLTDRPPLPKGPSPFGPATDPVPRLHKDLHELWSRLNGVRAYGGLGALIADWDQHHKAQLLDEVRRISELMREWDRIITEGIDQ